MFKNIFVGLFAAVLVVVLGTAACTSQAASNIGSTTQTIIVAPDTAEPVSPISEVLPTSEVVLPIGEAATPVSEVIIAPVENLAMGLSADEAAALIFMIEEEKLARDVYNVLAATWNIQIFQNIVNSEQSHIDQLSQLVTTYSLLNPTQAPGVFTDSKLQELYNTLITQGNKSLNDAIKVGGAIEEIDILDLQTRLAQTDNADIQLVYTNLLNGSYNHLKSFSNTLSTQGGEIYSPQYLAVEQYQTILSSTQGKGTGQGKATPKP